MNFKRTLLKIAGPRLEKRGYEYDKSLEDRNWIFGFRKNLEGDVSAIIKFQRSTDSHERPTGYRFVIQLSRRKPVDLINRDFGYYEGGLGNRLGHLLWFDYGLRTYDSADHWWPETLEGINEALDILERYAIPWLDDPDSRLTLWLNDAQWNDFAALFEEIIIPELMTLGYSIRTEPEWRLPPHGVKPLQNGLTTFILFNPLLFFDPLLRNDPNFDHSFWPDTCGFDILLFRKRSTNPFDENWKSDEDCFEVWASKLLPQKYGVQISSQPPGVWRYTNQAELKEQLNDALSKLKEYANPWLEDPQSRRIEANK